MPEIAILTLTNLQVQHKDNRHYAFRLDCFTLLYLFGRRCGIQATFDFVELLIEMLSSTFVTIFSYMFEHEPLIPIQ